MTPSLPRLGLAVAGSALCLATLLPAQTQYTQGFQNLARTEAPGTLLSHPSTNGSANMGRTVAVGYVNGWIVVGSEEPGSASGSDNMVRVYDITNPAAPARKYPSDFGLNYGDGTNSNSWYRGNYGWDSHGTAYVENYFLISALHVPNFGGPVTKPGAAGAAPTYSNVYPFGGFNRSAMSGPWSATMVWYPAAGTLDQYLRTDNPVPFTITKRIRNAANTGFETKTLASFYHMQQYGGPEWHPIFFGDLLIYARSGGAARDGVVVYRLAYNNFEDRATMSVTPQLVGTFPGGLESYWPNLFSDGTGLYLVGAGPSIVTVLDLTRATDPASDGVITKAGELVTSLSHATYPVYQDQFAFIHNKKIDITRLIAGDPNPIVLTLNETANNLDTSQMSLPLGNLWLTGGYQTGTRSQGMGVWVQSQAPDTTRPEVSSFHIPQSNRANYPRFAPLSFLLHEVPKKGGIRNGIDFKVRPVGAGNVLGTHVPGFLIHDMSGQLTFNPDAPLAANTTYQVDFLSDPANGVGFQDAAGNYIVPYTFRFSTGGSVNANPPVISGVTASTHQPAPGSSTRVTASATGTGLQYRFNFNGVWTTWSTTTFADFTYNAPGRYRVIVQVKNAAGEVSTSSVNILVITPPSGPFPTQSNTLVVGDDSGTRRLWTVNPDGNTVAVLNASTGAKIAEHVVGKHPRTITRDQNGRYWVAVQGEDKIVVLNSNGTVFQTLGGGDAVVPYGSAPYAVCATRDGTAVYATYYGSGKVVRFAVPAGSGLVAAPVVSATSVPTARAIAVTGNGARVFVTRFISSSDGSVHEFDGASAGLTHVRRISLQDSRLVDGGDRAAGFPNYLSSIAISPDQKHALVASKQDNINRGELYGVPDLTHETTVRAIVSVIDLTTNAEIYNARRDFDNSDSPSALAFSPLGDMAFVALQGNNRVAAIDALKLGAQVNVSATLDLETPTGLAPQGILADGVTNRFYAQNFMGRSVTVYNGESLFVRNNAVLSPLVTTSTQTTEPLPTDVLLGKEIFYNASDPNMSTDGYISCASCHVDGGHDGRVWDFTGRGEGLRRTIDLRGRGGLAHGNVHWSGNFDEIHDFELDITGPFKGAGFRPTGATLHPALGTSNNPAGTDELDFLAAYVSSLGRSSVPRSPHRQANGVLTADAAAGKLMFEGSTTHAFNCTSCHSGANFTDSIVTTSLSNPSLKNVGTISALSGSRLGALLPGIDTPTLLGLHANSGFLHNGIAATLEDVFLRTGGALLEAEEATELWSIRDVVGPVFDTPSDGGGGAQRGIIEGGYVNLGKDTEDANNNQNLDPGEDLNGNGVIDTPTLQSGVRFTNVDGGVGGSARIGVRCNASTVTTLQVIVNNVITTVNVPGSGWRWVYADVSLNAGATNTVDVRRVGPNAIDCVLISNKNVLNTAAAHSQVYNANVTATDRTKLMAYLRSIDGRDANGKLDVLDNLVARYAFETTTLGADSAGAPAVKNGTVSGTGITRVTTNVASGTGATSWNGATNNRIEILDHDDLDGGSKFTISVRIRPDSAGVDGSVRAILSKRTGVGQNVAYSLFLHTGGNLYVDVAGSTRINSPAAIPANVWTHVVVVYDGTLPSAERVKLYLNGALAVTTSNSSTTLAATTASLNIGMLNAFDNRTFSGLLDDIRLYKGKALTPDEILVVRDSTE